MALILRLVRLALALTIGAASYFLFYRPLQIDWGASAAEIVRPMPGDPLVHAPLFRSTRAITIAATPERIWPWVAQLGGRGVGWSSYDVIDNRSRESTTRILPASRHTVGAFVLPGKDANTNFLVREMDASHRMLWSAGPDGMSWTFELVPAGAGHTRVVSRLRMRTGWTSPLALAAVDAVDFVMMREMLKGIRDRAEGRAIRSFASLTTEFLLWAACFAGVVLAGFGVALSRRWLRPALVQVAVTVAMIGLVLWQPPVWVDGAGAFLIFAAIAFGYWPASRRGRAAPFPDRLGERRRPA